MVVGGEKGELSSLSGDSGEGSFQPVFIYF